MLLLSLTYLSYLCTSRHSNPAVWPALSSRGYNLCAYEAFLDTSILLPLPSRWLQQNLPEESVASLPLHEDLWIKRSFIMCEWQQLSAPCLRMCPGPGTEQRQEPFSLFYFAVIHCSGWIVVLWIFSSFFSDKSSTTPYLPAALLKCLSYVLRCITTGFTLWQSNSVQEERFTDASTSSASISWLSMKKLTKKLENSASDMC